MARSLEAEIREIVADALAPVLPGRVRPYRPDRLAAAATPLVWVDRVDTAPATVGPGLPAISFEVAIVAVVDGAAHAAQALRDELSGMIRTAVLFAGLRWEGSTSTSFTFADDITLPSVEAACSKIMHVTTLCPPEPVQAVPIPVPVPPQLVKA